MRHILQALRYLIVSSAPSVVQNQVEEVLEMVTASDSYTNYTPQMVVVESPKTTFIPFGDTFPNAAREHRSRPLQECSSYG